MQVLLNLSLRDVLLIAAQPRGPVADAADRVEAQALWADVLPAQERTVLEPGTRYKLLTGRRVREVAYV